MRTHCAVGLLIVGLACSNGEEPADAPAADPAALRATCTADVAQRCSEFQRAEQFACVQRGAERCVREADAPE